MIILCDFDDTVAAQNVGQMLLEHFQPDETVPGTQHWSDVRQRFIDKQISLAEYQEITFRQVEVPFQEMARDVRERASIRPGFAELAAYCHEKGLRLAIVSHGLDFYVEALLESEGITIPYHAVTAIETAGEPTFTYQYADETCDWWPGNCKCQVLQQYRDRFQGRLIYAGDSASDACPAMRADFVFARGWLVGFCSDHDLPYAQFTDFHDVLRYVKSQQGDDR